MSNLSKIVHLIFSGPRKKRIQIIINFDGYIMKLKALLNPKLYNNKYLNKPFSNGA